MKIKVKLLDGLYKPEIIKKGDWVDLRTLKTVEFNGPEAMTLKRIRKHGEDLSTREVLFDYKIIPMAVCMELPKGFEATVLPRSSTFNHYGIMMANSEAVIDNSYNGDNDIWGFPAVAFRNVIIPEGSRIAQFRIQLSQKATRWQKIKWLFSSKIELEFVDHLGNKDRDGFGSTGK